MAELILYACPVGPLADVVEEYWRQVAVSIGTNSAHHYMPHVTLTGFFHDEPASVEQHVEALDRLSEAATPPAGTVSVTGVLFEQSHHLLLVESDWCRSLAAGFAETCPVVRVKDRLHLSLAYGFPAHDGAALERLGRDLVDPSLPTAWELRFYERTGLGEWCMHAVWPL